MQADNPFVNAGIFYVQNVRPGDASAWFLEELNRRIARFTYHPETVTQLPSSGWSTPNPNPNPDPNPKPNPKPNPYQARRAPKTPASALQTFSRLGLGLG